MAKKSSTKAEASVKSTPTLFPRGFSVGKTNHDIIILEFIDPSIAKGEQVLGSFALPVAAVKDMIRSLSEAIKE